MTKNSRTNQKKSPIFRSIAHYIWPVGLTLWGSFSSFILARNHLHSEEFVEIFLFVVILLGFAFLLLLAVLYLVCKGMAFWRHEQTLRRAYAWRIFLVGGLVCISVYVVFQERNPLRKYGVEFRWHNPPGSTGSWYEVHIDRNVNGTLVEGMSCGGGSPRVTFSDEDLDGIPDIVVRADRRELAVFTIVEPYIENQRAFRVIRRTDTGDFGCSYPRVLMTESQEATMRKLFLEMHPRLKAAQQSFIVSLSHITEISEEDIATMIPRLGQDRNDITEQTLRHLEQRLGRTLTEVELQQIKLIGREKHVAMQSIREEYAKELAPLIGLDIEETMQYFF